MGVRKLCCEILTMSIRLEIKMNVSSANPLTSQEFSFLMSVPAAFKTSRAACTWGFEVAALLSMFQSAIVTSPDPAEGVAAAEEAEAC